MDLMESIDLLNVGRHISNEQRERLNRLSHLSGSMLVPLYLELHKPEIYEQEHYLTLDNVTNWDYTPSERALDMALGHGGIGIGVEIYQTESRAYGGCWTKHLYLEKGVGLGPTDKEARIKQGKGSDALWNCKFHARRLPFPVLRELEEWVNNGPMYNTHDTISGYMVLCRKTDSDPRKVAVSRQLYFE